MSDGFTVSIDTSRATVKLGRLSETARASLRAAVIELTVELRTAVQAKLRGPVLNYKSGALFNSIKSQMVENATSVYGRVYSDGVAYAAIHEYGGKTPPHDIVPKNGSALAFMMGGRMVFAKVVHHPGSTMPERSYMRSTLDDMRGDIIERLTTAAHQGTRAA